MTSDLNHKVILFDGVCNLCNGTVVFIIKRDKRNVFKFATLQSEVAHDLLIPFSSNEKNQESSNALDSIILLENGKKHTKSSAALRIAKHLSGAYPLLYGLMIIPKFLRDWGYSIIAKNRYKWFGKKESCMIPTPELQKKFL